MTSSFALGLALHHSAQAIKVIRRPDAMSGIDFGDCFDVLLVDGTPVIVLVSDAGAIRSITRLDYCYLALKGIVLIRGGLTINIGRGKQIIRARVNFLLG